MSANLLNSLSNEMKERKGLTEGRMARFLQGISRRFFSTDRMSGSWNDGSLTLEECPANHAVITGKSRANHALLEAITHLFTTQSRGTNMNGLSLRGFIHTRALRYVAVLFMVFVVGIGNVWGNGYYLANGYWGQVDLWFNDHTANCNVGETGDDQDWGANSVTLLSLTGFRVNVYQGEENQISWSKMYYRFYKYGSTPPSYSSTNNAGWKGNNGGTNGWWEGSQHQTWELTNQDIYLVTPTTESGYYYFDFYFDTDDVGYLSNNSTQYRIYFTVADRVLATGYTADGGSSWSNSERTLSDGSYTIYNVAPSTNIDFKMALSGTWTNAFGWSNVGANTNVGNLTLTNAGSDNNIRVTTPSGYRSDVTFTYSGSTVAVSASRRWTVTYSDRGAATGHKTVPTDVNTYSNGTTFTVKDNTGLMWSATDGKVFAGWATTTGKADAGTVDYQPGDTPEITSDLTLYPVWTDGAYLFELLGSSTSSDINTTDFEIDADKITTAYEVNGVTFSKTHAKFKNVASPASVKGNTYSNKFWIYDATHKKTKLRIYVKNTTSTNYNLCYNVFEEGVAATADKTVQIDANSSKMIVVDASSTKGARFVVAAQNKAIVITQIVAAETGDVLPKVGENKYELAFPGRAVNTAKVNSNIVITSETSLEFGEAPNLQMKKDKHLKFTTAEATTIQVTAANTQKIRISDSDASEGGVQFGGTAETHSYTVGAGTWYVAGSTTTALQVSKIKFVDAPTITYNANGGSSTMSTSKGLVSANGFTAPSGKVFVNWNDATGGGGNAYEPGDVVQSATTLYAQWGYALTYDKNTDASVTNMPTSPVGVKAGSTNLASEVPVRSGYIFVGWQVAGAGTIYQPGGSYTMPSSAVTMKAKWVAEDMKITDARKSGSWGGDKANGNEITSTNIQGTISGGTVVCSNTSNSLGGNNTYGLVFDGNEDQITITVTDKNFVAGSVIVLEGYSVNTNSTSVGFTASSNAFIQGNYTTTAAEYQKFRRTYIVGASDGIITTGSFTLARSTSNKVYLYSLQVGGCEEPSCPAYTLDRGGQESGTYTVGDYDGNTLTCTPSPSGTYTYQWKQYKQGDPNGAADTINAVGDGANTASFTPGPASAGTYYYMCRVLNACGDKQVTSTTGTFVFNAAPSCSAPSAPTISGTTDYVVGETMTLTASCESGADASTTYTWYKGDTWGSKSQVQAAAVAGSNGNKYTKTAAVGDAGTYWCEASNGTGCEAHNSTGKAVTVVYKVTYNNNGGSGIISNSTGTSITLSNGTGFTAPSDYTFDGWNTAADGSGSAYTSGQTGVTANLDLYARWKQTVTIDDQGGSNDGSVVAHYNGIAGTPTVPTYSGHTVDLGYYAESSCTNKVMALDGTLQASVTDGSSVAWTNSSSKWIKTGSSTLYAHWKCNTPEITDNGDNTVSISVPSGTTVRYTTDGSAPSSSTGTVYSSAFTIASNCTVKAIAYQTGCTDSEVASESITLCTPVFGSVTFDNNKSEKYDNSYNTSTDVEVIGTATWTQSGVSSDTGHPMTKPAMKLDSGDDYIKITLPSGITSGTITVQACTYNGSSGTLIINDENNTTSPLASAEVGQKNSSAYYMVNSPDGESWTAPTLATLTYSSISAGGDFYIKKSAGANIYVYAFSATSENACDKPTVTATRLTAEYMPTGSSGVQIGVTVTGASTGWKYRVKNKNGGYETPDDNTYSTSTWTMTSTIGTGANTYKVELYDNSATPVKKAVSSVITVYGEVAYPMTISAGTGGSVSPTSTQANGDHINPEITATPSDGYHFVNWTLSNSNATLDDEDAATTTITSASGACTITANFAADCTKPSTPVEDAGVEVITHNSVQIGWDSGVGMPSGTQYYKTYLYDETNGVLIEDWSDETTVQTYTKSGLTPNTCYIFKVKPFGDPDDAMDPRCEEGDPLVIDFCTEVAYTIAYNLHDGDAGATVSGKTSYTAADEDYDLPTPTWSGHVFEGWYTTYSAGTYSNPVSILPSGSTGDKTYHAKWSTAAPVVWTITKVDDKLYKGGGGYNVKAVVNDESWSGSADNLVLTASDGVVLGTPTKSTVSSKAQITADFGVGCDVEGDEIHFTLTAPAAGTYGAIEDEKTQALDDCPGGRSVIFTTSNKNDAGSNFADMTSGGSQLVGGGIAKLIATGDAKIGTSDKKSGYRSDGRMVMVFKFTKATDLDIYFCAGSTGLGFTLYSFSSANELADITTSDYSTKSEVKSGSAAKATFGTCTTAAGSASFNTTTGFASVASSGGGIKVSYSSLSAGYYVAINSSGGESYFYGFDIDGGSSVSGIATSLTWSGSLADKATVNKHDYDDDFTYTATKSNNSLGEISYSSSNESVATVNASGKVHIVGDGTTTITATVASCGCYNGSSISYTLVVANSCADTPGTIVNNDGSAIEGNAVSRGACETLTLKLTGYTGTTIQWQKDGANIGGATSATYTIPAGNAYSGVYSANISGACTLATTNSITVTTAGGVNPTIFADEFTVKSGRPFHYRLMQMNKGESVTVKSATSWTENTDYVITTDNDNIVYISSTTYAGVTIAAAGTETITLTISNECGSSSDKEITIHKIEATAKPTVAWIATGDNKGADYLEAVKASESTNTALYKYLETDYTMTARNCYWSTNEADLVKEYSKYDLVILTDYPNSATCPSGKSGKSNSYTNAIGLLIDHRPLLTFEAFVAACPNWGIPSDPHNTKEVQNSMTLLCNADDIFGSGSPKFYAGTDIEVASVGSGKQSLQGFAVNESPDFVYIGKITDDGKEYISCCERQVETGARMMVFGLNSNVMNNITNDGKEMVKGFVDYLLIMNPASIPDCSVIFDNNDGAGDGSWFTATNWEGGSLPNQYAAVRIDAPCVVADESTNHAAKAGYVKIHVSTAGSTYTGQLTIAHDGAMIVQKTITRVEDNLYTVHKPTQVGDIVIESASSGNGTLIFDNKSGTTKATVEMYSKSQNSVGDWTWQYVAVPYNDNSSAYRNYYGSWLYRWAADNSGWEVVPNRGEVYPWVGYCLTQETAKLYVMDGTLVATTKQSFTVGNNQDRVIGNSWTAPIQVKQFTNEDFGGLTKNIYLFNTGLDEDGTGTLKPIGTEGDARYAAGTYIVVPIHSSPYTGDSLISSLQAFTITNTSGSDATLTLNYDKHVRPTRSTDKVNAGPMHAPRRYTAQQEGPAVLKIWASGTNFDDRLVLLEGEGFSTGYDDGWDGEKIMVYGAAPEIYSVMPNGKESVTATPDLEGTLIGFRAGEDSEYTFQFNYNDEDDELYLLDTDTEIYTLIRTGNSYSFTTSDKAEHNRFILTRNAPQIPTGNQTATEEVRAVKFIKDDKMYILLNGVLYDATGKHINNK